MVFITHIHMDTPRGGHEHIASVKWRNPSDSQTGSSTIEQMVDFIEKQKGRVQVTDGHRTVEVGVVNAQPKYIRTHADGVWTDNLLALPRY
jgi:hypothetical protein